MGALVAPKASSDQQWSHDVVAAASCPLRIDQSAAWSASEAACAALQAYGVHATSTMIVGKGAGDPRATNATAAGRALNRRIELIVTCEPATQHGGSTRAGHQARSTSSAT